MARCYSGPGCPPFTGTCPPCPWRISLPPGWRTFFHGPGLVVRSFPGTGEPCHFGTAAGSPPPSPRGRSPSTLEGTGATWSAPGHPAELDRACTAWTQVNGWRSTPRWRRACASACGSGTATAGGRRSTPSNRRGRSGATCAAGSRSARRRSRRLQQQIVRKLAGPFRASKPNPLAGQPRKVLEPPRVFQPPPEKPRPRPGPFRLAPPRKAGCPPRPAGSLGPVGAPKGKPGPFGPFPSGPGSRRLGEG